MSPHEPGMLGGRQGHFGDTHVPASDSAHPEPPGPSTHIHVQGTWHGPVPGGYVEVVLQLQVVVVVLVVVLVVVGHADWF